MKTILSRARVASDACVLMVAIAGPLIVLLAEAALSLRAP
jgi:hypothetical protein